MTRHHLRRPIVLAAISLVVLAAQHILLRVVEHEHVAHVLLGAGNALPGDAATLAIALLIVRFVAFVLVPGLMLAAAAEVLAYVLVGPPRQ